MSLIFVFNLILQAIAALQGLVDLLKLTKRSSKDAPQAGAYSKNATINDIKRTSCHQEQEIFCRPFSAVAVFCWLHIGDGTTTNI